MCEGLLSVFLNNNHSRQQIFYKKQKPNRLSNSNQTASCGGGTLSNQKVLLDLGSVQQTISFYADSFDLDKGVVGNAVMCETQNNSI